MPQDLNRLKQTVFQLLLVSENRTTDNLEIITSEQLQPVVLKQGMYSFEEKTGNSKEGSFLLRESYLHTEKTNLIISQNIAFIYPDHIPVELYSRIIQKKEGIGKVLKQFNIPSSRKILSFGYRYSHEVVDLFNEPYKLIFSQQDTAVPFKEYEISFNEAPEPSIHLLEYFNPAILSHHSNMSMEENHTR